MKTELKITKHVSELMCSNMYVVDYKSRYILIDPFVTDLDINIHNIDYILLTHEHYDHISGVNYWKNLSDALVVCSDTCARNLESSRRNLSRYFEAFCELQTWVKQHVAVKNVDYTTKADLGFLNMHTIKWMDNNITLKECPGHSSGSSVFIFNSTVLFSGDSLFKEYPTEIRLPGGEKSKWYNSSLPFLKSLDKSMHVYPGHFDDFILKDYKFWEDNNV